MGFNFLSHPQVVKSTCQLDHLCVLSFTALSHERGALLLVSSSYPFLAR